MNVPRLPKQFPGRHLVLILIVGVLLAIVGLLDELLMDDLPWINLAWAVPIITAAYLLSPLETVMVGLVAMIICAATVVGGDSDVNLWSSAAVGAFGVLVAIKANFIRRYFRRINLIRDALEESPLAYAEFSFPGYKLANFNQTFTRIANNNCKPGARLSDLLSEENAGKMAGKMDEAIATRTRVDSDEFHLPGEEGRGSFWQINFIPVSTQGGGTPRSVALFAYDITDSVIRGRTREAALRISAAVMSSLSLDETLRVVLDNMVFTSGTDAGALLLLEDDQWVGKTGYGQYSDEMIQQLRFPYDDIPVSVAALESKEAIASENPAEDMRFSPELLRSLKVRSLLMVPLVSSNRSIGVVWLVQTDKMRKFTEEQIKFAMIIGSHAALAIENAGIYENEHYIRKSLEAIEAISEAGLVSLDLEEVLIELVTRAQDVMQMDAAMILLADETGSELVARAAAGNLATPLADIRVGIGEGLAGRAFQDGVPMKVDNLQNDPESRDFSLFTESSGIRSVLAVPLRVGGRVSGVLQIGSQREKAFSAREWGLIQVLADRASMAVQNSVLHEKTMKELARVAMLRDVAAACAGSHDIRKIASSAMEAVYEQMGCFRASVYYLDEELDGLVNLAFMGHSPKVMDEFKFSPMSRGTLLTRAVLERRMITHEEVDLSNATESEAYILKALNVGDNRRCTLPIIYKEKVVGGMALVWPDKRPFTPATIETIMSVANQLAVAIHTCELPGAEEVIRETASMDPASVGNIPEAGAETTADAETTAETDTTASTETTSDRNLL